MYPKVKVRIERDDDDQFAYEKSSLEFLKAFEWLSLHHSSSSDESPVSVVRVPRSYAPKSPTPCSLTSNDTNKKKAVVEENLKNIRPASAPRPRAVLSSPDIDGITGGKTQTRGKLSGLKNRPSNQNRHIHCKNFPKFSAPENLAPTKGYNKVLSEPNNDMPASENRKKITPKCR